MENIRPLIISNHYLTFVKDQTEELGRLVGPVTVAARANPLHELILSKSTIDWPSENNQVVVYKTAVPYLPFERSRQHIGRNQFKKTMNIINSRNIEFDLIHSHFLWSSGFVGAELKRTLGKPLVLTAHGYDIYSLPFRSKFWKEQITEILNAADAIITVSGNNRRFIEELNISNNVEVIPNGYSPNLFYKRSQIDCRSLLGLPQEKKVIVCVGNLVPIKGHQILIQAMIKVMSEVDALCYIVGSGQLEKDLNKEIHNLGLSDKVFLVGGRPHEEIPYWIGASDLFVLPSLMEGNPTVMFECLACGKPFIGTKVGGIPEIITSTDYGLLVEPGDVDDLHRQIMIGLFKNWDENKILEYAVQFSWPKLAERIVAVYSKLLHL